VSLTRFVLFFKYIYQHGSYSRKGEKARVFLKANV